MSEGRLSAEQIHPYLVAPMCQFSFEVVPQGGSLLHTHGRAPVLSKIPLSVGSQLSHMVPLQYTLISLSLPPSGCSKKLNPFNCASLTQPRVVGRVFKVRLLCKRASLLGPRAATWPTAPVPLAPLLKVTLYTLQVSLWIPACFPVLPLGDTN